MAVSTVGPGPGPHKTERVRFIKGTCYNGVDFGPEHRDVPVSVPDWKAREYYRRGVAVPEDEARKRRRR